MSEPKETEMNTQTSNLDAEVHALSRIAGKPSLTALAYALRHPETWPEGFEWDYGDCESCAMGLAGELWAKVDGVLYRDWIARSMAMPYRAVDDIFFELGWTKTVRRRFLRRAVVTEVQDMDSVGPDDVADAIDRYLAAA